MKPTAQFRWLATTALVACGVTPLLQGAFRSNTDSAPRCTACAIDSLFGASCQVVAAESIRDETLVLAAADEPMITARPDIPIADFEGKDYGDWKTTGEAFGKGPAQGTLPGQMPVSGFEGHGLVNSFLNGDGTTGTLTSPSFTIERKYLNFLIGGGRHPETCINLLVGDKIVRTATGPNGNAGGTERLDWHSGDVAEFAGKKGLIEIIDRHTGGWGHINVDQIGQSDKRLQAEPARRELVLSKRYLALPVKTGARQQHAKLSVEGKTVREFEFELADGARDFQAFSDVGHWIGKKLTIEVDGLPADSTALDAIEQSDTFGSSSELYHEPARPQFHFTSRRGWLNDPNGLVYFQGEYHLFYQHNPFGWNWGNMHWGHAVSRDLLHWQELPIGIYPREFGDWAFSGSAVVDAQNTAGFQQGTEPALIAAYTSTGRGECIAYSTDRGRTWTDYAENPVVKHAGRDPKLIWHAPTKRWVMAVYDEYDGKQWIAFHTSPDLKQWELGSRIEGFFECPDLFELPVANDPGQKRWVLYAADGKYVTGQFDGRLFTPDHLGEKLEKRQVWFGNFYAAQTFSDTPDGRRIQIGWGTGITFPGMPFNQQMTVPTELTLQKTDDGIRMFANPVAELATIREKLVVGSDLRFAPGKESASLLPTGDLLDAYIQFESKTADKVEFSARGVPVVFDFKKKEVTCRNVTAPLAPVDGRVSLRILVDRGSIEIFGNAGRVALSIGVQPDETNRLFTIIPHGGEVLVRSLQGGPLKSTWAP